MNKTKKKIEDAKELMQKVANNYMQMQSLKDAPENETWEAKVFRIKQTAERVNKAIGYEN